MDNPGAGTQPEWLGRLAHDLRNPITPMRSAVQLLQLGQLPPELTTDLLRTLDRQIDALLKLIDDVADLVKIDRGGFALQAVTCDLGALASAAVARHERRGSRIPSAPVEMDALPEPLLVRADEVRVRQLLEELLGCLGSCDGARIASIRLDRDGSQARLRLTDSGRPLGQATCLDFLASGELPQDVAALTMGWLVARRILELHDATLAVVDDGTAVELRLPLA